jgi:hypothetical protein
MEKLKFKKKTSKLKAKVRRQKIMVPIKRSYHKEHIYESHMTYHSKDKANITVFMKWVKLQGHEVKNGSSNRKVV